MTEFIKQPKREIQLASQVHGDKRFFYRRYTHDLNIFNCVVPHNEYKLPKELHEDLTIIDIGAHIGSFSFACLTRGAKEVYAYEAHPENYAVAKINIEPLGGNIINAGVWRSDKDISDFQLFNEDLENRTDMNTGGVSVIYNDSGIPVKAIALDGIIDNVLAFTGKDKIDLLKIDCEGSEYPILLTSKHLDKVYAICGEYHEIHNNVPDKAKVDGYDLPYDRHTIKDCLERNGFKNIKIESHGQDLGLFFADRK